MASEQFDPEVAVLQLQSQSREDHLATVRIDVVDRPTHILFYEDGDQLGPDGDEREQPPSGKNDFTILGPRPGP
jgi:hypothetical protein